MTEPTLCQCELISDIYVITDKGCELCDPANRSRMTSENVSAALKWYADRLSCLRQDPSSDEIEAVARAIHDAIFPDVLREAMWKYAREDRVEKARVALAMFFEKRRGALRCLDTTKSPASATSESKPTGGSSSPRSS